MSQVVTPPCSEEFPRISILHPAASALQAGPQSTNTINQQYCGSAEFLVHQLTAFDHVS